MDAFGSVQIVQMVMTASAGLIGVGIGIGMFKSSVQQVRNDLKALQRKQARLRGEDNGNVPLFMSRSYCERLRQDCLLSSSEKMQACSEHIGRHSKSIKSLENFARWWMQKEGLKIEEINKILMD